MASVCYGFDLSHFQDCGQVALEVGSQYGGTQAQNLDSLLPLPPAFRSPNPVLPVVESLDPGN